MNKDKKVSVAGMGLGGGKKENFFFCLFEYFPDKKRWFLTSLKQVRDEESLDRDEAIMSWVEGYQLKQLVVDFPTTNPHCDHCDLKCPGTKHCHHPIVVDIRTQIDELLGHDKRLFEEHPKSYERARLEGERDHYLKDAFDKETHSHYLSKSFKRKLKKGYLPYWNRPIDFWVWKHYYDQILSVFDISYDSFGNISTMLLKRFHYLLRHLPGELKIYESHTPIVLLELYRSKIIRRKHLVELQDIELGPLARIEIIRAIEKMYQLFIYEKDFELLVKNPKAFQSFLLAIAGQSLVLDKVRSIPNFGEKEDPKFIAPHF